MYIYKLDSSKIFHFFFIIFISSRLRETVLRVLSVIHGPVCIINVIPGSTFILSDKLRTGRNQPVDALTTTFSGSVTVKFHDNYAWRMKKIFTTGVLIFYSSRITQAVTLIRQGLVKMWGSQFVPPPPPPPLPSSIFLSIILISCPKLLSLYCGICVIIVCRNTCPCCWHCLLDCPCFLL